MTNKLKEPPYPYCSEIHCFKHGLYDGKCADHKITELQAELNAVHERIEACQQYTTNSAMVREGRFMEVVAVRAALNGRR